MTYHAPVADQLFAMTYAAGEGHVSCAELADGTAASILDEAAAIARDVLAPLDRVGDTHGVTLVNGGVQTAPGWPDAYRTWVAGGWNGVSAPTEAGGMGLPLLINAACFEIWSGANLAFALASLLTAGAIEALHKHGSADLRRVFLPRLVSGEWTGTMNLTEPQAGSDLSALKARAEPSGDGSYRIKGEKIYITYGDQDMTENIIHLVLARLPDAPAGTRGISLFLVPKFLVDGNGGLGARNDLRCAGLERKLGMHGAPTCTMIFGENEGAVGYIVGDENKGLACMFTMMNNARLAVGLEGVAAAEHATQKAVAFARERRQGRRDPTSPEMAAIIEHPDVARMLMTMKASTAAARAICYVTAAALDGAKRGHDAAFRKEAADRAALLTPIAKAFSTDIGIEVASLGVQVHGGMGYIEDTGAAQILRDCRITAIYEGTNGIQAIDLVTRKLPLEHGAVLDREVADMRRTLERLRACNDPAFGEMVERLTEAVDALAQASHWLATSLPDRMEEALAGATPYLRLFGLTRGGACLADLGLNAHLALTRGDTDPALAARISIARFFAENLVPAARGLAQSVMGGARLLTTDRRAWIDALQ